MELLSAGGTTLGISAFVGVVGSAAQSTKLVNVTQIFQFLDFAFPGSIITFFAILSR